MMLLCLCVFLCWKQGKEVGERGFSRGFLSRSRFYFSFLHPVNSPDSSHRFLEDDRPAPQAPHANPAPIRQSQTARVLVEGGADHRKKKNLCFLRLDSIAMVRRKSVLSPNEESNAKRKNHFSRKSHCFLLF